MESRAHAGVHKAIAIHVLLLMGYVGKTAWVLKIGQFAPPSQENR